MKKLKATFKTLGIAALAGAVMGALKVLPEAVPQEIAAVVLVVIAYVLPQPWKEKLAGLVKDNG